MTTYNCKFQIYRRNNLFTRKECENCEPDAVNNPKCPKYEPVAVNDLGRRLNVISELEEKV